MSQDKPEIKYYFCKEVSSSGWPTFAITPKAYFDRTGFLYDSSDFNLDIVGFQRVSDSKFEYVCLFGDPEEALLQQGEFMWRDMVKEIQYTYKRRRLLGIEPMC
jgi:hypothetical protein